MPKFHVLERKDGETTFREVDGEAVEIGGYDCFIRNANQASVLCGCWVVADLVTGLRLTELFDTRQQAMDQATERLNGMTVEDYEAFQEKNLAKFGRSPSAPEPEIQIVQGPQEPGEIKTCVHAELS